MLLECSALPKVEATDCFQALCTQKEGQPDAVVVESPLECSALPKVRATGCFQALCTCGERHTHMKSWLSWHPYCLLERNASHQPLKSCVKTQKQLPSTYVVFPANRHVLPRARTQICRHTLTHTRGSALSLTHTHMHARTPNNADTHDR
jgi:hypothetical protein